MHGKAVVHWAEAFTWWWGAPRSARGCCRNRPSDSNGTKTNGRRPSGDLFELTMSHPGLPTSDKRHYPQEAPTSTSDNALPEQVQPGAFAVDNRFDAGHRAIDPSQRSLSQFSGVGFCSLAIRRPNPAKCGPPPAAARWAACRRRAGSPHPRRRCRSSDGSHQSGRAPGDRSTASGSR